MKNLLILILFIAVFSCSDRNRFNQKDLWSIGRAVDESIKLKDTAFVNSFSFDRGISYKESAYEWYDGNVDFIGMDTIVSSNDNIYLYNYYKKDTSYASLRVSITKDSTDNWNFNTRTEGLNLFQFYILDKKCIEWKKDYYPIFEFKLFVQPTVSYDNRIIRSLRLKIVNDIGYDVDYVRFKSKFYGLVNGEKTEIFNRTIVYDNKVYKGDVVYYDMTEFTGYQSRYPIYSTWYEPEILEIRPQPKGHYCMLIEKIEAKYKEGKYYK